MSPQYPSGKPLRRDANPRHSEPGAEEREAGWEMVVFVPAEAGQHCADALFDEVADAVDIFERRHESRTWDAFMWAHATVPMTPHHDTPSE